jgi:hypothetical protein
MGIDSQVEVCVNGNPTGKLLALQVKSGTTYFHEISGNCIVVRGEKVHYEYWTNHSLPVLLVVYNPETGETLWQHLTKDTVTLLKNGWKTGIHRDHKLTRDYRDEIADIAEGPEHLKRLRRLQFDKPLIQRLAEGDVLFLEFEKWVNKSLARTPLTVKVQDDDEKEHVLRETFLYYVGYTIEEMLCRSFPWADCEIDEDYYGWNMDEESVESVFGIRDFWDEIYPYTVEMGEVASYRVLLKLNRLGESFLDVDEYLSEPSKTG